VSEFPFLRVSFRKEPGTRLKNRFYAFLNAQMSGYNLSSILEQFTTGSRVPENVKPAWIPSPRFSNVRVPRNPEPTVDLEFPGS
jgi:hypothetical protein